MIKEPEIIEKIEIAPAIIEIREDGIMHIHVKIDMDFNIQHSIDIVEARTKLANGKSFPMLYTLTKFVIPSNEVSQYLASEDRSKLVLADAFVINSLPQRLIGNFYMKFKNPVRPTKIFTDKEKAINWLSGYTQLNE